MSRIGREQVQESAAAAAHMVFELMAALMVERVAELMEERMAVIDSKAELSKLQTAIW